MSAYDRSTRHDFGLHSTDEPVFFPTNESTYCGLISIPTSGMMRTTGVVLLAGTGAGTGTVGRNRMWVKLARTLADAGTVVLRFDYAGVGDSSGDLVGDDLDSPAVDALRAAFDVLESRGIDDIVLVGTCYGARTALAGSVGDPRVTGIYLLVPPVRSPQKGSAGSDHLANDAGLVTLARKAIAPRTMKRLLRSKGARKATGRVLAARSRSAAGRLTGSSGASADRAMDAAPGFVRPLLDLLEDGVPVRFLFGQDDFFWMEFEEALRGRLGRAIRTFGDLVQIDTIPGVLRGFPSVRVQDLTIDSVVGWVRERTSHGHTELLDVEAMSTRTVEPGHTTEEIAYFGSSPQLYGITHVPAGDSRASVVICSSTHAELLKSYRLEVLLARALASRGVAVHRFHYRGDGNSEATWSALELPEMIKASRTANTRIADLTGTDRFVFVGIRLGAYPATVLATESGGSPLVLWDPVLDTDRFVKDALRSHATAAIRREAKPESVRQSLGRLERDGSIEVLGYEMTSTFHSSIQQKKLDEYCPDGSNVLVVPFGSLNVEPLAEAWGNRGISVTQLEAAERAAWWLVEDMTADKRRRNEDLAARTADWIAAATS